MITRVSLLAAGVLLAAGGCTTPAGDTPDPSVTGTPSVAPPPSDPALTTVPAATALPPPSTRPSITASVDPNSIAGQAAALSGPARGTMSLVIDGLGEVNSAVTGECGGSTVKVSAPEAASVVVTFGADKSTVRVTDAGLDLNATLLPGEYTVKKPNLAITTTFRPQGGDAPGGRLELKLVCG
ncbi:hypothetical protein [Actinokineospora sp. HUAS TT18]|uniref:hypothetical protein n=1 Tax=Actinokineospora sp. HUAS TT18 TaxID=3447451 RepID=UPI003F525419